MFSDRRKSRSTASKENKNDRCRMRQFSTLRNKYRKTARKTSSFPCGCLLFAKSFSTVRRNSLLLLGVFKVSASAFSSDCSSFPQSLLCGIPILRRRKRFHKIYLPFSQPASVSINYRHAERTAFRPSLLSEKHFYNMQHSQQNQNQTRQEGNQGFKSGNFFAQMPSGNLPKGEEKKMKCRCQERKRPN